VIFFGGSTQTQQPAPPTPSPCEVPCVKWCELNSPPDRWSGEPPLAGDATAGAAAALMTPAQAPMHTRRVEQFSMALQTSPILTPKARATMRVHQRYLQAHGSVSTTTSTTFRRPRGNKAYEGESMRVWLWSVLAPVSGRR